MSEMIGYCGYRCGSCLIYRENLKKDPRNQQIFRDKLEKYYSDNLPLEACHCDGCLTPDSENPDLITKDCKIRPCALTKGLESCAYCVKYPCEMVTRKNIERAKIEEKYGAEISEADYKLLIKPYESSTTLARMKQKKKE
ncbi:MAG TPA: DUF3795 domain-containing protein [Dehalococcoidales bacterium]|nr:DUF3795 domain-containing protein [Dehalococcoidales bacterium]